MITLLIESRERQGITIRELGEKLGSDHTMVTKVENFRRALDLGEFFQFCHALNEDPAHLIKTAKEKTA